jgi:hypothetical protein
MPVGLKEGSGLGEGIFHAILVAGHLVDAPRWDATGIHTAMATIIRFSVDGTKPSGASLDPSTQAHLIPRVSWLTAVNIGTARIVPMRSVTGTDGQVGAPDADGTPAGPWSSRPRSRRKRADVPARVLGTCDQSPVAPSVDGSTGAAEPCSEVARGRPLSLAYASAAITTRRPRPWKVMRTASRRAASWTSPNRLCRSREVNRRKPCPLRLIGRDARFDAAQAA